MTFRAFKWAVPALLAASVAQAAPEPSAIDRATAMTAPVENLARAALATAASRFTEVERPNFGGMRGPDAPLTGLRFATAAEMAGYPGLCKATTAWIDISAGGGAPPMETAAVYKVVGDLAPLPDMWNATYEAALTAKCATAGRVIPTASGEFGQAAFFQVGKGGEDQVWAASRALQRAVADAKAGLPVACDPRPGLDADTLSQMAADDGEVVEDRQNQEGCARAGATLAGLPLDRLLRIDVAPCPESKDQYCLSANFLRFAYDNRQALWQVSLQYQRGAGDNADVDRVTAVTLEPSSIIYD
jgi:hypothetical protein